MKEYTIVRRPKELDWNKIPAIQISEEYHQRCDHGVTAQAQLCYDETALYVRLQAQEANIRAEHRGLLDEVCEDSCLEFFFCPIPGDDRYLNLEVNPNGAMYKGIATNVHTLQRLIPEEAFVVPKITMTQDGWVAEYAIPYPFVQLFFPNFSPAPGKSIRANCYKCSDLSATPHWLCWCPVVAQPCAFHNPSCFGTMYFE